MSTEPAKQATPPAWPMPNPALKGLSILSGEWEMALFNAGFGMGHGEDVGRFFSLD